MNFGIFAYSEKPGETLNSIRLAFLNNGPFDNTKLLQTHL